jgi:hypothetical protein
VKSTRLLSWLTFLLVAIVLAACSTSPVPQLAAQVAPSTGTASEPTSVGGVTPYIIEGASPGGNRTCAEVGLAFFGDANYYNGSTARVDYPGGSSFTVDGITVTVTNGTYVAFDSPYPIGAVIVKGSDDANVYVYDPQVWPQQHHLLLPQGARHREGRRDGVQPHLDVGYRQVQRGDRSHARPRPVLYGQLQCHPERHLGRPRLQRLGRNPHQ